jgi:hypothetical protein
MGQKPAKSLELSLWAVNILYIVIDFLTYHRTVQNSSECCKVPRGMWICASLIPPRGIHIFYIFLWPSVEPCISLQKWPMSILRYWCMDINRSLPSCLPMLPHSTWSWCRRVADLQAGRFPEIVDFHSCLVLAETHCWWDQEWDSLTEKGSGWVPLPFFSPILYKILHDYWTDPRKWKQPRELGI